MKKIFFLISVMFLFSCADTKVINGKEYRPYGLLNESTCKNDSIEYQISGYALFSGIVFCELVFPSIYTFGYNLYEPVRMKNDTKNNGIIE